MNAMNRRLSGALAGIGLLAALFTAGAAASVPVDLRVVSSDAGNLASVRQYVPATTTVSTMSGPDCFNGARQSSGRKYGLATPTMLGAIWEAAQVVSSLQPVRLSDADYAAFGALGVCQIGAPSPPGFFFLKANHQALIVGADLFTVQGGEDLLAYRTPADFSADEELDLSAPVQAATGSPVTVNVRAYSTTVAPRAGATLFGGDATATTDANGNATVTFATPGLHQLVAVGDYNDIPSPVLSVCVDAQPAQTCPTERGIEILGSDEAEGIKGTDGDDTIRPRAGNDGIKAGAGADLIVANGGGRDRVFCGGGKDTVLRDRKDRISKSCEVVQGAGKKKHKGKKKGKHGK
jgi:hypothetical protein